MAGSWFVNAGGKVHGPFNDAKLRTLAVAGKVTPDMPIARSATGPWTRAAAIRGLFVAGVPAQVGPAGPPPLPPAMPVLAVPLEVPALRPAGVPDFAESQSTSDTPRNAHSKKWSAAKLWGAIGGMGGVAVVLFNIGVLTWNGYLQTDTAAINLIKKSMQETFAKDPGLAKPVKVLDVELRGKGTNRTGSATVTFGGNPQMITFTAKVTRSGKDLQVDWKTEDLPQPAVQASDLDEAILQEQLQAFVVAASDLGTVETQLSSADVQLTPQQISELIRKLVLGWGELRGRAKAMRDIIESRGLRNAADPVKARNFTASLVAVETATPAILRALNTILSSKNDAEIQASFETYWNLSEGVGAVFQQIAPTE